MSVQFIYMQLSSELDATLSLAYDALDRSQKCKAYQNYIKQVNNQPRGVLLRALLPILSVHSQTAEEALNHVTDESFGISRILNELEACANDLSKFSEQNHTLADQLDCYIAPGQNNSLSNEKRAIAEIEEAVVERIENLSVLTTGSSADDKQKDDEGGHFTAMSDLCQSLFTKEQTEATSAQLSANDYSESQMLAADVLSHLC